MSHSFTNLLYHIVFSTKNRHPWLERTIRPDVFEYLGGLVQQRGGIPLIVNGIEDHIHLFAKLRQDATVAAIVRDIKANSSLWIHKTFPELAEFSWQRGYGAFTVSQSQRDVVRQYIANQEAHHAKQGFEDEFRQLLRRHGIEFTEEELWD